MSGELDGWIQQMRAIAESSCLRISLISHSLAGMEVLTLSPPIFKVLHVVGMARRASLGENFFPTRTVLASSCHVQAWLRSGAALRPASCAGPSTGWQQLHVVRAREFPLPAPPRAMRSGGLPGL